MKKHLLFLFAAFSTLVASAQTKVEIDGIWYNLYSNSKVKVAEVIFKGNSPSSYWDEYSGSITIPATVTYDDVAYSVTSIGDYAFCGCSSLTAITLPEGVKSIGWNAFEGCSSLTAINIPESVTSIGLYTFSYCSSLTAITFPESLTSIGDWAFQYCSSLTAINIPESVTSIGDYTFSYCSSLTAINIPEGVTSIGVGAFLGCSSLTAINIPEGVTWIGGSAFRSCSSLTAINIPEGVTRIGDYAFTDCSNLTTITIPEGVTSIGICAFEGCSSLTAITIPESVTGIEVRAFSFCSSLTAINIPEGVTYIGNRAFEDCISLTTIMLPKSVKFIYSEAFANCPELTDVYCHAETVPSTNTNAFDGSFIEYATLHVPTSAMNEYKNTAPWSSFGKVETLDITVDEITLSQSAAELIEGESLQLTATVAPDDATDKTVVWSTSNAEVATVDENGVVTAVAEGTATITATANDGSGVSASCEVTVTSAQTKVEIDGIWYNLDSETEQAEVTFKGDDPFSDNEYSSSITLPATVTYAGVAYSVTSIGSGAFRGCDGLTSIIIPASVTSIGDYAFCECRSLTAITLPESVTSIGNSAFHYCSNLTTITLPEGVTSIGYSAFCECSSLTAITIPEGVTSIGDYTIYGCSSLTAITIPKGVKSIGVHAFTHCSSLTAITCKASTPPTLVVDPGSFYGVDKSIPVYVPAGSVEAYKVAEGWSEFTNISISVPITHITLSQSSATLTEGEDLTLTMTTNPENADRNLISWSSSNPSVATVDNTGKVTAIAPGTATITAMANDGSGVSASCEVAVVARSYALTFLVDGDIFLTDTLTRGTVITLPEEPTKEGHTFSGWGKVPETMPAEDLTISGTFIVNKYLVTFKIGDEVIASDSLEYQSAIVAPEAPEKEGYTFSGWGEVADSVPAHDLTYEGSYSINSYVLTYVVDGEAVLTWPVVYGATIPSLKAPEKEGYTFSGWGDVPETMPAKDVTIEGAFTQLPSVYLTINQADNGCVKQHIVVGTVCTYTIEAAEGWKIHSVTFNGEDVTSQLTEEGTFTTPELQDDATLNIAYEKIDDAIESTRAGAIKVQGHQGIISISGTTEGEAISLYTTDGTLVTREIAEGDTAQLTVPTGQVYIVKVADAVVKIGM